MVTTLRNTKPVWEQPEENCQEIVALTNTGKLRREHGLTVPIGFVLLDPDYDPLAIDIRDVEEYHRRHA